MSNGISRLAISVALATSAGSAVAVHATQHRDEGPTTNVFGMSSPPGKGLGLSRNKASSHSVAQDKRAAAKKRNRRK